jgi:hypothetical protein
VPPLVVLDALVDAAEVDDAETVVPAEVELPSALASVAVASLPRLLPQPLARAPTIEVATIHRHRRILVMLAANPRRDKPNIASSRRPRGDRMVDDIGAAVAMLLAPKSAWINDQRIEVSGGQHSSG